MWIAGVGPGQRLAGKRELPAHEQHQTKTEVEKEEAAPQILDADGLVVGGKNVGADEAELVMLVAVVSVTVSVVAMPTAVSVDGRR